MKTCPPNVHERILSYFNQLSYAEWFETANTAGWPSVLCELRSLRAGDCTIYPSCGQVADWHDLHEYPGDICGCVEGMLRYDSASYTLTQWQPKCQYSGNTSANTVATQVPIQWQYKCQYSGNTSASTVAIQVPVQWQYKCRCSACTVPVQCLYIAIQCQYSVPC